MGVILPAAACRRAVHTQGSPQTVLGRHSHRVPAFKICFPILSSAVKPVLAVTWEGTIVFLSMAAAYPAKS